MAELKVRHRILEAGQYLGEISALSFVHLPSHFSPLPFLLAGTGSEILLFDINLGRLNKSFPAFDGIRVHGISCDAIDYRQGHLHSKVAFTIAVYGERRVKLFSLEFQVVSTSQDEFDVQVDLVLLQVLPMFSHWVLDVCFCKDDDVSSHGTHSRLAVGCSDNSVHVWDVLTSTLIFDVRCPERCLLYSMRLFSSEGKAIRVASGTIFNEIVVWEAVDLFCSAQSLSSSVENADRLSTVYKTVQCGRHQYEAKIICILAGHQGSIFRLSWSTDGSKLVSVSDDRSARIWCVHNATNETHGAMKGTCDLGEFSSPYAEGLVLFGHNARVWDCCIHDSLIVTAGEDCTCRIWGMDGKELRIIKEHIGKGIWRCVYDPGSSLVVTAGFDSAVKVHQLCSLLSSDSHEYAKDALGDREEVITLSIPNSSAHMRLMDSKSEYVRCLRFASEEEIYVATNHGYLYHASVSGTGNVKWSKLAQVSDGIPIVCMDLLSKNMCKQSPKVEHWVSVGDGEGRLTVLRVQVDISTPKVGLKITWLAELERQLLATYWSKPLGNGYVFTSDPRGSLKLWKLSDNSGGNCDVSLIGEFKSTFGSRIMCLDVSVEEEVLICGDLHGNLVLFPLSSSMLHGICVGSLEKVPAISCLKGAHGISTVSSISFSRFSSGLVEIYSTGGDGCICYLEYNKHLQTMEFVGMKQVKELSLIQSVSALDYSAAAGESVDSSYAVGFSSANFLIWNILTETKVMEVKCGGWRRPHAYYFGRLPEINSNFAYVKDNVICIRRHRFLNGLKNVIPRNLHLQFHGRELHSLCFITKEWQPTSNVRPNILPRSCWIATGCEDGTVRLTRYSTGVQSWSSSKLLGEHVGGSAVRSICCVSKVNYAANTVTGLLNGTSKQSVMLKQSESPFLLVSVGAKRVLTSWLLRKKHVNVEESSTVSPHNESDNLKSSSGDLSSMSFKWLSTDMPNNSFRRQKRIQESEKLVKSSQEISIASDASSVLLDPKKRELKVKPGADIHDNDWRYLAVTAFLVELAEPRLTICLVVVACSDATLTLRALVLPYRYWFDVAILGPLSSPILSLQHIVIPLRSVFEGCPQSSSIYVVISGSTDGTIAFWDLGDCIEAFIQWVSALHLHKLIDCQKRPQTGRGSQGGRWWRSIGKTAILTGGSHEEKSSDSIDNLLADGGKCSPQALSSACSEPEENYDGSLPKCFNVKPLHVMNNVHQSGVNCLHVSEMKHCESVDSGFLYNLISGGDDQAICCLQFDLAPALPGLSFMGTGTNTDASSVSGTLKGIIHCCQNQRYRIRWIFQERLASAHSSAVKGVWTDGSWVFSTGLDQRVRCWRILENGKLIEHTHLIISVPEPESLDARACGSNYYQVAVAGRGMQVVEFSAPDDTDIPV